MKSYSMLRVAKTTQNSANEARHSYFELASAAKLLDSIHNPFERLFGKHVISPLSIDSHDLLEIFGLGDRHN